MDDFDFRWITEQLMRCKEKEPVLFHFVTSKKVSSLIVCKLTEQLEDGARGNQTSHWLDKSSSSRIVTSSLPFSSARR